jgi:hypothetical protein
MSGAAEVSATGPRVTRWGLRVSAQLSPSEHDWAFAKRALARGDEPEEVVRKIADYRDDEKHANYARCTVEKTQAELQPNDSAQQEESRVLRGV